MVDNTANLPTRMAAMVLTGHGGIEKLEYRDDVLVPTPGPGDALLELGAEAVIDRDDLPTFVDRVLKATGGAPFALNTSNESVSRA
ncbi:hypothetical protein [Halomonas llamarensis]|uniref:Uncharacterized protein n=1 Tax=Halomonas llamarensis TaxID=2945104 RepID=A0ABT0STK1_9GAMM|nr:hypothetical protein [Halomonas llamarensis]MCL7931046.1 hypothetical protein [Halomonas llamarensis]